MKVGSTGIKLLLLFIFVGQAYAESLYEVLINQRYSVPSPTSTFFKAIDEVPYAYSPQEQDDEYKDNDDLCFIYAWQTDSNCREISDIDDTAKEIREKKLEENFQVANEDIQIYCALEEPTPAWCKKIVDQIYDVQSKINNFYGDERIEKPIDTLLGTEGVDDGLNGESVHDHYMEEDPHEDLKRPDNSIYHGGRREGKIGIVAPDAESPETTGPELPPLLTSREHLCANYFELENNGFLDFTNEIILRQIRQIELEFNLMTFQEKVFAFCILKDFYENTGNMDQLLNLLAFTAEVDGEIQCPLPPK